MTDLDAVLQAILEHPDDDLPRLQYADLLEEQGQGERAEFIRVQLELADLPKQPGIHRAWTHDDNLHLICKCHGCQLHKQEQILLYKSEVSYLANWWHWIQPLNLELAYVVFRRGFLESITCPWEHWHAHADAITAQHPIREVRLTTHMNHSGELLNLTSSEVGRSMAMGLFVEAEKQVLQDRWPKIRVAHFELPSIVSANWGTSNSTPLEDLELARQRILQSTGIPKNIFNPQ